MFGNIYISSLRISLDTDIQFTYIVYYVHLIQVTNEMVLSYSRYRSVLYSCTVQCSTVVSQVTSLDTGHYRNFPGFGYRYGAHFFRLRMQHNQVSFTNRQTAVVKACYKCQNVSFSETYTVSYTSCLA